MMFPSLITDNTVIILPNEDFLPRANNFRVKKCVSEFFLNSLKISETK